MIRHKRDLIFIKYAVHLHLFHFMDGHGACDIIAQNEIQIGFDELSGLYLIQTGVRRQNFLCHCHSHSVVPPNVHFINKLANSC